MTDKPPETPPEPPGDHDRLDLEAELRTAGMVEVRRMPWKGETAHEPYGLELDTGRLALCKSPIRLVGNGAGRPFFEHSDQAVKNEVAAYEVAKIIDIEHLVPAAVLRKANENSDIDISVHERIEDGINAGDLTNVAMIDIRKAAAFDEVVGQSDRLIKNWMTVTHEDGTVELKLIDHGCCFDWDPGDGEWPSNWVPGQVRSRMIDECKARGVEPAYEILLPLLDETKRKPLEDLLDADQLAKLIERVKAALKKL